MPDPRASGRAHEGGELLLPPLGLPGPAARVLRAAPRSAVEPETRRNEVLSLIRGRAPRLLDQSDELRLGHPAALGPEARHVRVVRRAAPTTSPPPGTASDDERFARMWPADIHMIGKDILRQHAVYWPAMLMAAGIEPPDQVWAHGYLTVGGKKMSKTNLTGIHPFELLDRFGVDSYRWYFLREVQFGQDGSFSLESMVDRHNAELANGIGNLASRVLAMLRLVLRRRRSRAHRRGCGIRPSSRGGGRHPPLRRGDACRAAYGCARRRLRRRRSGQPLHGRAVAVDHGEGRRQAGGARLDPVRLRRDPPSAHDPDLSA